MHDIWNPWHGCVRASEGCDNCYMFFNDERRGIDPTRISRTANFSYPLQRKRDGSYKVQSGELIRVCMTSDFLLPEADPWRPEAWGIIHSRPDVRFYILTKRPERFAACLPADWGDGWDNVMLNVTCENQRRANERVPLLLATPAKHRGVMCAPLIGPISLEVASPGCLREHGIEQVICGGENYGGDRPCDFAWIRTLRHECEAANVTFAFTETGTNFIKDGRRYRLQGKRLQSQQAGKSGMSFQGHPISWHLTDPLRLEIPVENLYRPRYFEQCELCGSRLICNGCAQCATCWMRSN